MLSIPLTKHSCLRDPPFFNKFLKYLMSEPEEGLAKRVSISWRSMTDSRFGNDNERLAGHEEKLIELTKQLHRNFPYFRMEIIRVKTEPKLR